MRILRNQVQSRAGVWTSPERLDTATVRRGEIRRGQVVNRQSGRSDSQGMTFGACPIATTAANASKINTITTSATANRRNDVFSRRLIFLAADFAG